jgi:thioredoxin 1
MTQGLSGKGADKETTRKSAIPLDSGPWYRPYASFHVAHMLHMDHVAKEADMSGAVLELTEATFDEEVGSSPVPVLVEFWAEWCPPCRQIAPILDSIAAERKVNSDERPDLARRYDVMSIPTILVFAGGELVQRMVGARSQVRLLEELSGVLVP